MSATGPGRALLLTAGVVVVAVLAAAMWVIGSPAAQRELRLDERRVADLERIEGALGRHVDQHARLPGDLSTLARQPGVSLPVVDPVDGTPYGYEVLGPRAYRLCAVFSTDTAARDGNTVDQDLSWLHAKGRQCFDRSIKDSK